jgi:hypothetical protein
MSQIPRLPFAAAVWLGAASLLLVAGCGGKPATVSGTITLDGTPLARGSVAFTPVNGGQKATGVIASDGSYSLNTNRDVGLDVGEYRTTVVSREPGKVDKYGGPPLPGKYLSPKRYANGATSGLQYNVTKGHNSIDIELTSKP